MATKKKRASKPRAPRRVAIKTSLAAADIWANNAALRALCPTVGMRSLILTVWES